MNDIHMEKEAKHVLKSLHYWVDVYKQQVKNVNIDFSQKHDSKDTQGLKPPSTALSWNQYCGV